MSVRDDAGEVFGSELLPGETIVWTGQPDAATRFSTADTFLIPFSILWGGFALFWEGGVLTQLTFTKRAELIPFALFGLPFVLIGCYFTFGRFLYKAAKKQRTYYALTDKRVLMLTRWKTTFVQSKDLESMSTISKSVKANGVGTLTFGYDAYPASFYANTGMEMFGWGRGTAAPAFYDIRDAESVYRRINQLRANAQ